MSAEQPNQFLADRIAGLVDEKGNRIVTEVETTVEVEESPEFAEVVVKESEVKIVTEVIKAVKPKVAKVKVVKPKVAKTKVKK